MNPGSPPSAPAERLHVSCRLLACLGVAMVLLLSCSSAGDTAQDEVLPSTPIPPGQDPGLAHVHGLGVNPANGDVYAATHFGLWRVPADGQAHRVADTAHDLMGFTVIGPDHFVASGHPLLVEELPPLLGLIETTDAGETWRSVSMLGDVDFHGLRYAHDAVWGWSSSDGALLVSEDRKAWDRRSTVTSMLDFAVDPEDADHVVAATAESLDDAGLQRSDDGGRTWEPAEGPALARLAWADTDRLFGAGLDGTLWRSTDAGQTWEKAGEAPGRAEAFVDADGRLLLAAGGSLFDSADDGATWNELYRGTEH